MAAVHRNRIRKNFKILKFKMLNLMSKLKFDMKFKNLMLKLKFDMKFKNLMLKLKFDTKMNLNLKCEIGCQKEI